MLNELRLLIREIICEKRRLYVNDRIEDVINTLKAYVNKGLFFHFTDDYHLQGVNVKSKFSTPFGIYVYPLDTKHFNLLIHTDSKKHIQAQYLRFASERKYILIYRSKGKMLIVSQYTWDDLKNDAKKLNVDDKLLFQALDAKSPFKKKIGSPTTGLFTLLYDGVYNIDDDESINNKKMLHANRLLYKLGYAGVYDDIGAGVIHPNEPTQAFFIDSKSCEIVDVIKNPEYLLNQTLDRISNNLDIAKNIPVYVQQQSQYKVSIERYKNINKLSEQEQIELINEPFSDAFRHIRNPSKNVILAALRVEDNSNLQFVKISNEDLNWYALKHSSSNFPYIKNPTPEMQMFFIEEQNGISGQLGKIQNLTFKPAQIRFVEKDGTNIEMVINPDNDVKIAAIKSNPKAILFIEHPTIDDAKLALKLNPKLISKLSSKFDNETLQQLQDFIKSLQKIKKQT